MTRNVERNVIVSGRGPIISVALGLCFSLAIAYNALGRQTARHPAPIPALWIDEMLEQTASTGDGAARLHSGDVAAPDGHDEQFRLVSDIQRLLSELSLYEGTIDGLMGPQTRAAIAQYQSANGITVTGQPSAELLEHLRYTRQIRDALDSGIEQGSADSGGDLISLVQTGLSELGYNPGPIDGVLGEQTRDAIRQFERDRRMQITGQASEALVRELSNVTGLSSLAGYAGGEV